MPAAVDGQSDEEQKPAVRAGESKYSDGCDCIVYRVSLFFSAMMAVVMFGFGIYTVAAYFMSEKLVAGWSPLMGLLSLGFLSLFLLMTFMFKYLETIVKLLFKKQKYSVQTIENMNCYEGKKGGCVNDK